MKSKFSITLVNAISHAQSLPAGRRNAEKVDQLLKIAAENGWLTEFELESLLPSIDYRLTRIWDERKKDLLNAFGLSLETVWFRPKRRDAETMGIYALSSSDLVILLSGLEAIGFKTGAANFIAGVARGASKKRFVTNGEVFAIWHPKKQQSFRDFATAIREKRQA